MFCRVTQDSKYVYLKPTWLGRLLKRLTRGRFIPHHTFTRDFGVGCFDGRCLKVSGCSVTLKGNLLMNKDRLAVEVR